jgi:hypothetical protein
MLHFIDREFALLRASYADEASFAERWCADQPNALYDRATEASEDSGRSLRFWEPLDPSVAPVRMSTGEWWYRKARFKQVCACRASPVPHPTLFDRGWLKCPSCDTLYRRQGIST